MLPPLGLASGPAFGIASIIELVRRRVCLSLRPRSATVALIPLPVILRAFQRADPRNCSYPVRLGSWQRRRWRRSRRRVRKLIAFDDDTFDKLKQLGRDRMATVQELADEAFADLLRKHGIPIDLKDALRKSASVSNAPVQKDTRSSPSRKPKS